MLTNNKEIAELRLFDYVVPVERYPDAPIEAQEIAFHEAGYPMALVQHPERGWFVLMAGQGDFIAWREGEPYETPKPSALAEHKLTGGEPGMTLDDQAPPVEVKKAPYTVEDFVKARERAWA
jgi:hypothetical protein